MEQKVPAVPLHVEITNWYIMIYFLPITFIITFPITFTCRYFCKRNWHYLLCSLAYIFSYILPWTICDLILSMLLSVFSAVINCIIFPLCISFSTFPSFPWNKFLKYTELKIAGISHVLSVIVSSRKVISTFQFWIN